ncbi:MAG: DNA (cytosine-5-)-methyltransferase [Chloroflexi bacterium]|nr:DNA (cytosine-5-)-methyltransferase [Chloroflexota bacterium]
MLRVVSLFAGIGGMDLGSEGGFSFLDSRYRKLPARVVYAMDIDEAACDIYNANFSTACHIQDILDLDSHDVPDHDILTGGFPCQAFSIIAQNPKRLGYKDDRGKLFFEMCRILRDKQPLAFIAENVKGLLSANNGEAFPLVIDHFEDAGYHVTHGVLNASHFGVPQKRERVFIVGFKDKSNLAAFRFPDPTTQNKPVVLRKVVMPEETVEAQYYFSDNAIKGLMRTKNKKSMNKGRIQDMDQPCNTVAAHLAKVSLNSTDPVLCENGRYRRFTPREVARIQSFPESFELSGTRGAVYRGLGNAVPPVVMWHLMSGVLSALGKKASPNRQKTIAKKSGLALEIS